MMKVSVVVPNLNGGPYLRDCLASLANQDSDLEVLFIDGGSTDGSWELARDYSAHISVAISEPDSGQSNAINKGLALATGDVVCYMNSDDVMETESLALVSRFFSVDPQAEWLAGGCRVFGDGVDTWHLHAEGWATLLDTVMPWARPQQYVFPQSGACFMRRSLIERLGQYDETLHYSMDMEYYVRAAFAGVRMHRIPNILAGWRWHPSAKSWTRGCAYAFRQDEVRILRRYLSRLPLDLRPTAERALREQEDHVAIREANYWRTEGQRWKSAKLLAHAAVVSPGVMMTRPWLGAVRRVITASR